MEEAVLFAGSLVNYFKPEKGVHLLDLACGRGRYSRAFHALGFSVTGVDASPSAIEFCKKAGNSKITFHVSDFRAGIGAGPFDWVVNLFTSFGYFEKDEDNLKVLETVAQSLGKTGIFILDYLNPFLSRKELVREESRMIHEVGFDIRRSLEASFFVKHIQVRDKDKTFSFVERVRIFGPEDFKTMLGAVGLEPFLWFGDYSLQPFHENSSERMIIISKLKQS